MYTYQARSKFYAFFSCHLSMIRHFGISTPTLTLGRFFANPNQYLHCITLSQIMFPQKGGCLVLKFYCVCTQTDNGKIILGTQQSWGGVSLPKWVLYICRSNFFRPMQHWVSRILALSGAMDHSIPW